MPVPSICETKPARKGPGSFVFRPASTLLALVFACAIIPACSGKNPYVKETFVMGTKAWIKIYGLGEDDAEKAAGEALRELHRIESVMSNWKSNSEISRLNRESSGLPFAVTGELMALLRDAFHYAELTNGAFDITARPVVRLWGFQGSTPKLPADDEIDRALKLVDYRRVAVDTAESTIMLPGGMELDLAGIAKGYGVDRCISVLEAKGVKSALVNLGGNMYALGAPPGRPGWMIGIRDPKGGSDIAGSIILKDEAVATSGNYENFVEIGGRRYGHIIDPNTGRPVEDVLSVTVIAPTALASDALSTGMFVLGPDRGRKVLENLREIKAIYALQAGDGIRYVTLGDFGETLMLEDMETGGDQTAGEHPRGIPGGPHRPHGMD